MKSLFNAFIRLSFGPILLLTGLVSEANGGNPGGGDNRATTARVRYIPVNETQGVFNVVYSNVTGSRFSIEILDVDGDQLYRHIFTDKNFNRNFQLADPESYHKLVFVIYNYGDRSVQRFQAEASARWIEDVQVREIN